MTYMAGGGPLFVMGENTGFVTRNNSIIALVSAAGGGTITAVNPANNTQTVLSPFTGPTTLSTITYLAAAAVPTPPANGACVTRDASNFCSSVVFGPGNMINAGAGSLILVFDVNFLDPGADANSQTFTNNLIAYLAAPVVSWRRHRAPARPRWPLSLSEWGMLLPALEAWSSSRIANSRAPPASNRRVTGSRILHDELVDAVEAALEFVHRRGVGDADVLVGAEGLARDDGDVRLLRAVLGELQGVLNAVLAESARRCWDRRRTRPSARRSATPGMARRRCDHEIAALVILGEHDA